MYDAQLIGTATNFHVADANGPLKDQGVLLEEKAGEKFTYPLLGGMQTLRGGRDNQAHRLGLIEPCPLWIKALFAERVPKCQTFCLGCMSDWIEFRILLVKLPACLPVRFGWIEYRFWA